jgi:hypothetical protein
VLDQNVGRKRLQSVGIATRWCVNTTFVVPLVNLPSKNAATEPDEVDCNIHQGVDSIVVFTTIGGVALVN